MLFFVVLLLLTSSQAYAWSCDGPIPFQYLNPNTKLPTNAHFFFLGTDEFSKDPSVIYLSDSSNNKVPTTLRKIWERTLEDEQQIFWELIPNMPLQNNSTYKLVSEDPKSKGLYGKEPTIPVITGSNTDQAWPLQIEIQKAKIFRQPYTLMGSDHNQYSSVGVSLSLKPTKDLNRVVLFALWISKQHKGLPTIDPKSVPPHLYKIHFFDYLGGRLDEEAAKKVEIMLGGPDPCSEIMHEAQLISKQKTLFYVSIAPIDVAGNMGPLHHVLIDPKKITTKKSVYVQ